MEYTLPIVQNRILELSEEIDQLNQRLAFAHGLGDSSSSQGSSASFAGNMDWTKRRDKLRRTKEYMVALAAYLSGETTIRPRAPHGILVTNWRG